MSFINFKKWIEEAAPAPGPAPAPATAPASNSSGGTLKNDIAKVPSKLGCVNCSKDFKNWYNKRKKR